MKCSRLSALLIGALLPALAQAQTNLALNKPTWSTYFDFSVLESYRAVDSDLDTYWSSNQELNPWLAVDLQASYTVNRVKVQFPDLFPDPLMFAPFNWKLQYLSPSGAWVDAYSEGDPSSNTIIKGVRDVTFPAVRARQFRIYITYNIAFGIELYDFELFEQTGSKFNLNTAVLPSGGGTLTRTPNNLNYTSGSSVTLTATPAANYRFTGWSGGASGSTNPLTVTMNAAKTIKANFASTATANVALGRPVYARATDSTSSPSSVVDASSSTLWSVFSNVDEWLTVDLETNCTVTQAKALFSSAANDYPGSWKVQYMASNGTWIDLYSEDPGTGGQKSVTFPAVTARYFRLYMTPNWDSYDRVLRVYDLQLIGQTTQNYALHTGTNMSAAGTVTAPNGTGYAQGSSATLTATPAAGFAFTGWSGDASGTTNPLALTMSGNKSVVANFASTTQYKLTTVTIGNGTITRSPNATYYPSLSTVSLTPTGGGNYWFTGWSGDVSGTNNPLLITMNGPTLARATFATATCGKPADGQLDSWNDGNTVGLVQPNNNCYDYANNVQTDSYAQPGRWAGSILTPDILNCAKALAFSQLDGLVPTTKTATLPYGRTRICLVVDPYYDFHWYRQNADGYWTHKPGSTPARNTDESGNLITDPETADRGFYKYVCGYFSVCSGSAAFGGHSTIY